MKRDIFRDGQLQQKFIDNGYVKFNIADTCALNNLINDIELLAPGHFFSADANTQGQMVQPYVTMFDTDKELKKAVQRLTYKHLENEFKQLLFDYSIISGSLFIKPPGCVEMETHQHWQIADNQYTTLSCWIPLHDVNLHNGALMFIEKSHKIVPYTVTTAQNEYFSSFKDLLSPHFTTIPVNFGEAVIFCETLLHSSHGNNSEKPRTALQVSLYPTECKPYVYFFNQQQNEFDKYDIDAEFLLNLVPGPGFKPPAGMVKTASVPNTNKQLTYPEFKFRLLEGHNVRQQLYNGGPVYYKPYTNAESPDAGNTGHGGFTSFIKKLSSKLKPGNNAKGV